MAISYSAIRNHQSKVTMPSVENGWYLSSNIQKDPSKSIHTKRIDKVGDTTLINSMIEESPDRQCETINYFARGINPMVSVNYGQGQTISESCGNGSQAYLPYRIIRDGAFRPPVIEGTTNFLPLSRMPRIWADVCATPYMPIFTKLIKQCGTAEQTREVRNDVLKMSCIAQKTIQAFPDINQSSAKQKIRELPILGNVKSFPSCPDSNIEIQKRIEQNPLILEQNRPMPSAETNMSMIREIPQVYNFNLEQNRPMPSAETNMSMIREIPQVYNFNLEQNRPMPSAETNMSMIREIPQVYNFNLEQNRPMPSVETNMSMIKEIPQVYNFNLEQNRPMPSAETNMSMIRETPNVYEKIYLEPTRSAISIKTNQNACEFGLNQIRNSPIIKLQDRPVIGGFEGYKQLPNIETFRHERILKSPGLKNAYRS
jgi:hypothetical protein